MFPWQQGAFLFNFQLMWRHVTFSDLQCEMHWNLWFVFWCCLYQTEVVYYVLVSISSCLCIVYFSLKRLPNDFCTTYAITCAHGPMSKFPLLDSSIFCNFQNASLRKCSGHCPRNSTQLKYSRILQTGTVSACVLISTSHAMTCEHVWSKIVFRGFCDFLKFSKCMSA